MRPRGGCLGPVLPGLSQIRRLQFFAQADEPVERAGELLPTASPGSPPDPHHRYFAGSLLPPVAVRFCSSRVLNRCSGISKGFFLRASSSSSFPLGIIVWKFNGRLSKRQRREWSTADTCYCFRVVVIVHFLTHHKRGAHKRFPLA